MCICADLPVLIYVEDQPPTFVESLEQLAIGNWVKLFRCQRCGQLWRMEIPDKYQPQIGVKLLRAEEWESFDSKPLVIDQLTYTRGGLSDELCVWANCGQVAVKGSAYCAAHLYEAGARR